MRILHTADWHLKDKLGWVDRTEDLNRSLREIARILVDQQVEVMIVAGDIFRERLSKEELREAIADLARIFGPWLAEGGTILTVAGNHDNRAQLETLRDALKLAPGAQTGRIHLFPNADTLTLTDRKGQAVQFLCLPYPDEAFVRGEWASEGELNRTKQATCQRILATLKSRLNPLLKTVFISHIHVAGVPVGQRDDHHLSSDDEVQITLSDLPMSWAAYLAFGHIHKAQTINGAPHARYSGSIQALDLGEKDDEKGVVLVDIEPESSATPQWLPLESVSQIRALTVRGEAGLDGLEADEETLISATVECVAGRDNFAKIKRELRKLYPRAYSITEKRLTEAGELPPPTRDLNNVNDNIREFLRHTPVKANREDLLKLVEEILL